jgi:hypothetical protein
MKMRVNVPLSHLVVSTLLVLGAGSCMSDGSDSPAARAINAEKGFSSVAFQNETNFFGSRSATYSALRNGKPVICGVDVKGEDPEDFRLADRFIPDINCQAR